MTIPHENRIPYRVLTLLFAVLLTISFLIAIFWATDHIAVSAPAAAPSVAAVDPETAPNDINATLIISGAGFTAEFSGTEVLTAPTAFLGTIELDDVTWVNGNQLTAVAPWGMAPAVYDLTVVNPDGMSGTLPLAFTVTNGVGVWATGGPYGGTIQQLAMQPGNPATIYATLFGAGTFISEDSAENWEPIHDHDRPINLTFDAGDSDVLYLGADSNDMYRSDDNGDSWVRVTDDFHTQNGCFSAFPATHPATAGVVYFGMGSCGGINLEPGEGGVFYSADYGATWISRSSGLTDLDIQSLAIHPANPDTMLAGTYDGDIFVSADGGASWAWTTNLTDTVRRITFNPDAATQAWAGTFADAGGDKAFYTTSDLNNWTAVADVDLYGGGNAFGQMAFQPGKIWLAADELWFSADDGATWIQQTTLPEGNAQAIVLDPAAPQTIYVGTLHTLYKSIDGGDSWHVAQNGLAGQVPFSVAVTPGAPDSVYVKTNNGIYASHNGGQSWQNLDYGSGGFPGQQMLTVDPFDTDRIYFGQNSEGSMDVAYSPDSGLTWIEVMTPLPAEYSDRAAGTYAVAPSPDTPGRVLAATTVWLEPGFSDGITLFYRSDDYGMNWAKIGPTQPISHVTQLVYDAFDANQVYAGSSGSGLWRSDDGGATWQQLPIAGVLPPVSVDRIATHPNEADKLFVRVSSFASTPNPESELYVSADAGVTWQEANDHFLAIGLVVSPPLQAAPPYALYSGCDAGLCRSWDEGVTWESIDGAPRPSLLVVGTDGERSVIYLGTPGGLISSAERQSAETIPGRGNVFGGGVYRLTTTLFNERIALPIVLH